MLCSALSLPKIPGTRKSRTHSTPLPRRFPADAVKQIIQEVLKEKLHDAKYGSENTKPVADTIKNRLKGEDGVLREGEREVCCLLALTRAPH